LPAPKVLVIDSPACNAFAFGLSPRQASIAVTRGLIGALDRPELEAVLAHEMTHIKNRDTRLMAVATLCTAIVFRVAWVNIAIYVQPSPQWVFLYLYAAKFFWTALIVLAWACAAAGACVVMTRLAISHSREFLADAGAVELTKDPRALISALTKISVRDEVEHVDFATQAAMISPMRRRLFSTHPSLAERIEALRRALPTMVGSEVQDPPIPAVSGATPSAAAPNAFRARHQSLIAGGSGGAKAKGSFRERLIGRAPVSVLFDGAFWRTLRHELIELKPPTWVSHPYILVPAVLLNSAIPYVLGPQSPLLHSLWS
jgi:hypothetical protein